MQQRGRDDDRQEPQDQPGQPAWQDPSQSGQGWSWQQQPPQQVPYAGAGFQSPQAPKKNNGLKIAGLGCLGVAAVAVILVIAAAVASSNSGNNVNTTAAGNSGTSTAKASSAAAPNKPAGLGDTIDVTDPSGVSLAVTLVKVDAKATATDGFSTPDAGDQYYAAQFRIKDAGSAAWSDAPSNCVAVKDGKGQTFQATIVEGVSSGPLMADTANLGAGDSALGWIVFEVPTSDTVTTVQFTPLSGLGNDTAQWSLS